MDSQKTRHISDEEYAGRLEAGLLLARSAHDVAVLVPDIASAYKSRMKVADLSSRSQIFDDLKKQVAEAGITLNNDMKIVSLKMSEPTLDDTMPDARTFYPYRAETGVPYSNIL